ncbi:hypothetical protein JCM12856_06440 [Spirochaeta dissipatitropha]
MLLAASVQAESLQNAISRKDTGTVLDYLIDAEAHESLVIEEQILSAAREYVRAGELAYARELAGTVLLYNIDNQSAADLYIAIEEAERQAEIRQQQEALERDQARLRQQEEDLIEYRAGLQQIRSEHFRFQAVLGPLHYNYYRPDGITEKGTLGSHGSLAFRFQHPLISVGTRVFYDNSYFSFSDYVQSHDAGLYIWLGAPLWIGTALSQNEDFFVLPLHLRFGLRYTRFTPASEPESVNLPVVGSMIVPVAGVYIDQTQLNSFMNFSLGFDWLPLGTFNPEGVLRDSLSWDSELDIRIFEVRPGLSLNLQPSIRGTVIISTQSTEWSVKPGLALGVMYYAQNN